MCRSRNALRTCGTTRLHGAGDPEILRGPSWSHFDFHPTIASTSSFRGASEASDPGIHNHGPGVWIPGPRQEARPGMTAEEWFGAVRGDATDSPVASRNRSIGGACARVRTPKNVCGKTEFHEPIQRHVEDASSRAKFLFTKIGNCAYLVAVPLSHEGRFAIVTDVESGMRWTQWRRARFPCGRTALVRTAKSCGPGTPGLVPSRRGDDLAGDGD